MASSSRLPKGLPSPPLNPTAGNRDIAIAHIQLRRAVNQRKVLGDAVRIQFLDQKIRNAGVQYSARVSDIRLEDIRWVQLENAAETAARVDALSAGNRQSGRSVSLSFAG